MKKAVNQQLCEKCQSAFWSRSSQQTFSSASIFPLNPLWCFLMQMAFGFKISAFSFFLASLSFQKHNNVYLHYSFPCCPDVAIFLWFAVSVVNSSFINTTCESVLFREFHTSSTKKAPFPVPMSRMAAFSGISALSIHRSTRLMLSSPNLTTRRKPQTSVTRWVIKIKTNNKLEMSWASPRALCEASG